MSSVTSTWRQRRQAARNRRALDRALAGSNTPAMHHELQTLAVTNNHYSSVTR